MLTLLVAALIALPDATQGRPERMLAPTEVSVDVGVGAITSQQTVTPLRTTERDAYTEATVRARVEVGLLRLLKATLTLPITDLILWEQRGLGMVRFGDPTIGIAAGPRFANIHTAGFAELSFPTQAKLTLRPLNDTVPAHGAVVTTGGLTLVAGAFFFMQHRRDTHTFRMSVRTAYRWRDTASGGVLADLRLEVVVLKHLLLGFNASVLVPLGGFDQALISPSRLADSAGYVDAGLRVGYRFTQTIDLSASCALPVYVIAGARGFSFGLAATFFFGPY